MSSILETKKALEEVLIAYSDIIGVGIDPTNTRIRVYVSTDKKGEMPNIPQRMGDFPVDTISTPKISTLSTSKYRVGKYRPLVGGISAAHTSVTGGTL